MRYLYIFYKNLNLQKLLNGHLNPKTDTFQVIYSKLQQLSYFNTFIEKNLKGTQKESLLDLCGKFRMEHLKGGEVIFKEGDKSNDKLYIIFNGKVGLIKARPQQQMIQNIDSVKKTPKLSPLLKPAQLLPQKSVSPMSLGNASNANFFKQLAYSKKFAEKMKGNIVQGQTNEKVQITSSVIQHLMDKFGDVIRVLKRGDGFGEKALIDNVPRGLTACAYTEDLFLLILKKDDFDLVRQQFIQQMKEKKNLIFTKFPVSGDYSSKQLEQLAYSFDVVQMSKGAILTADGMHKKSFYLIQYGDILLEKLINNQMCKISILTKGQLLGEEIVLNENGCCEYNSIVLSNEATLMVIHKHEFVGKFPEECKDWVKQEYARKATFRNLFQKMNMESVETVTMPKSTKIKQSIQIKLSHRSIRSQDRVSEQDIGTIVDEKSAIYRSKYLCSPENDILSGLFSQEMYKSPKLGFIPSYDRLNNVLIQSFQQQHLVKIMKQKRRLELLRTPPLTTRATKFSTQSQSSETNSKHIHKHTFSTGLLTPCLSYSPNSLNSRDIG